VRLNIDIWQNAETGNWFCDIRTHNDNDQMQTEYIEVNTFCSLLQFLDKKIPGAKCIATNEGE